MVFIRIDDFDIPWFFVNYKKLKLLDCSEFFQTVNDSATPMFIILLH